MDCDIGSLLQIHYHFRAGGVSEVIHGYSEAFSAIRGRDSFNALLCSCDSCSNDSNLKLINISECDYNNFTNKEDFIKTRDLLIIKIEAVLEKISLPAVILCHNMTIGKNPALSSALCALAKKKDPKKYRFFWVSHDFAEEGRAELLNSIEQLQKIGIDIKGDLFASGAPVHFVVPGYNTFTILKNAGVPVTCVPNPVRVKKISNDSFNRNALLENLCDLAKQDGSTFDFEKPIVCYPSRLIRRKNFWEAIALTCIGFGANLVLGAPGTSDADLVSYHKLINFVRESGLPVVHSTSRLRWKSIIKEGEYHGNPVPFLYALCDKALSTSLVEGFGYALYEPWLYHKAVFARRPAGFVYPATMDSSLLYDHFPIPLRWVKWKELKRRFQFYQIKNARIKDSKETDVNDLIVNDTIDFGALDEDTQLLILKKIRFDKDAADQFKTLLDNPMSGWPGLKRFDAINEALVFKNYNIISNDFSEKQFRKSFKEFISIIPSDKVAGIEHEKISAKLLKCGFKLFFSISTGYNENIRK